MSKQGAFEPSEHFRNLKGQQYLEVKWRVLWFREEHPDGYIRTELVEHDGTAGLAVFKAQVGYVLDGGREIYATGYGSETRKDFGEYLEKGETKAVGRALAMLGYGTQFAIELDEKLDAPGALADSPVERRAPATSPRGLAVVCEPVDVEALRAQVIEALAADAEAKAKLPKAPEEMIESELSRTLTWLNRRARALSS